jgi:hypothetical protein
MPWSFDEVKQAGMLFFPPLSDEREEARMVSRITLCGE